MAYLKLSESLNHSDLLSEAENVRLRLLDRYAGDARLWRLIQTDRRVALERLLWKQELTPDQYAAFLIEGPLNWEDVQTYRD